MKGQDVPKGTGTRGFAAHRTLTHRCAGPSERLLAQLDPQECRQLWPSPLSLSALRAPVLVGRPCEGPEAVVTSCRFS